jgi:hypothetical protein
MLVIFVSNGNVRIVSSDCIRINGLQETDWEIFVIGRGT